MCLLAPLQVVAVDGDEVDVRVGLVTRRVHAFDGALAPGAWVLVMGDHVVRTLEPATAAVVDDAVRLARASEGPTDETGIDDAVA